MLKEEELELEKKKLIEQLGVQLECENHAPVAARILSTLILTGKEGITFEELVQDLCASKSTISTHLDQLQNTDKVKYFTKPGDRKRYFIINPDLMLRKLDEMVKKWEAEMQIHESILNYKRKYNKFNEEGFQFDLEFQKDLMDFLNEATTALQKFKQKIVNKNHTNKNK